MNQPGTPSDPSQQAPPTPGSTGSFPAARGVPPTASALTTGALPVVPPTLPPSGLAYRTPAGRPPLGPVPRRRARRILWWTLGSAAAVVALVISALAWSQTGVLQADPLPVAAVHDNPRIVIADEPNGIVMAPAHARSTMGLVFIPGAKIDPWAYTYKLSGLVAARGMTVVITKPWFNFALFDRRPLRDFTTMAPEVHAWMVGGHSLGGVRACQLAHKADALVLFASYCTNDLSHSQVPVLSIAGSEDGLTTPGRIAAARTLLPRDTEMEVIPGASHSSFGNYGQQAGDGVAWVTNHEMRQLITSIVGRFAERVDRGGGRGPAGGAHGAP